MKRPTFSPEGFRTDNIDWKPPQPPYYLIKNDSGVNVLTTKEPAETAPRFDTLRAALDYDNRLYFENQPKETDLKDFVNIRIHHGVGGVHHGESRINPENPTSPLRWKPPQPPYFVSYENGKAVLTTKPANDETSRRFDSLREAWEWNANIRFAGQPENTEIDLFL